MSCSADGVNQFGHTDEVDGALDIVSKTHQRELGFDLVHAFDKKVGIPIPKLECAEGMLHHFSSFVKHLRVFFQTLRHLIQEVFIDPPGENASILVRRAEGPHGTRFLRRCRVMFLMTG